MVLYFSFEKETSILNTAHENSFAKDYPKTNTFKNFNTAEFLNNYHNQMTEMGGKIWAERDLQEGASFILQFPANEQPEI